MFFFRPPIHALLFVLPLPILPLSFLGTLLSPSSSPRSLSLGLGERQRPDLHQRTI